MKLTGSLSDDVVLAELGARLTEVRLSQNFTQASLAAEAGISVSTLARLENGAVATQLSGLLRVCRTLGLLERFELLFPEPVAGPMDELRATRRPSTKKRERARTRSTIRNHQPSSWAWGDES